jgi:hypothetical protein
MRIPLTLTALSLAALLSTNCGLLLLPVSAPTAALRNAQKIRVSLRIVDQQGNPLPGVTVEVTRHKESVNLLFGTWDNPADPHASTVDSLFSYESLHNYAVEMTFSKPGYRTARILFANKDHASIDGPHTRIDQSINVLTHPHVVIVLLPQ